MNRFYTYHIRIYNRNSVKVEILNPNNDLLTEPTGKFRYRSRKTRIQGLRQAALTKQLSANEVSELGNTLFHILFDSNLHHDFLHQYRNAKAEESLLRIELEIDEHQLPDIAALPWEFMCVPTSDGHGTLWLATEPHIGFLRRRALWDTPKPIELELGEPLRIALAVAAPSELGPVKYRRIWSALRMLANNQPDKVELLGPIGKANTKKIDALLEQKPHIFHFIGHARLKDENHQDTGQIALVDNVSDKALWIGADQFRELFNRYEPGVVILQSCEGAALSSSNAFVGVASQIVQQNVPIVVAMQYEVSNSTAQVFILEFYKRLAEGDPVDKAVQEGRRKIALGPHGYTTRDFATPVLFMRVKSGKLFQRVPVPLRIKGLTRSFIVLPSRSEEQLKGQKSFNPQPQILTILESLQVEKTPIDSYVLEFLFPLTGPLLGPDGKCPLWWLAQNGLYSRLSDLCKSIIQQVQRFLSTKEYNDVQFRSFVWAKVLLSLADCQRGFTVRSLSSLSDIHLAIEEVGISELMAWDLNIRSIISGKIGLESEAQAQAQMAIFVAEEVGLFWLASVIRLRVLHREDWHTWEGGEKPDHSAFEYALDSGLKNLSYLDIHSRFHLEALKSAIKVLHYSWSPADSNYALGIAKNTLSLLSTYPDHEERSRMISETGRIKLYSFDDPISAIESLHQSAPLRLSSGNLARLRYDLSWLAEAYSKIGDNHKAALCSHAALVLHNNLYGRANTDSALVKRVNRLLSEIGPVKDLQNERVISSNCETLAESTNIHPVWWYNLLYGQKH